VTKSLEQLSDLELDELIQRQHDTLKLLDDFRDRTERIAEGYRRHSDKILKEMKS
jgi:hypothetical protein